MKDILKSIPKFMYIIFILLIIIIILICIPFEVFEKKDDVANDYIAVEDNSGDIESINEKIKKDNEELGLNEEELSVSANGQVDEEYFENLFDLGEADVTSVEEFASQIDPKALEYNFSDIDLVDKKISGVGASIEKIEPCLIAENENCIILFADVVYVCKLDDFTTVYKLNVESDDLLVVHNMNSDNPDKIMTDLNKGNVYTQQLYMRNLSVQEYNDRKILVATYMNWEYDKYEE